MYWHKRQDKYNAKHVTYNWHTYQSAKGVAYAQALDWRVKAREPRRWERQVPIGLYVKGQRFCAYTIDS